MTNEELQLKKRFCELAERAYKNGVYTSTEFLSPAEQTLLKNSRVGVPYALFGGYDGAEKALALFGSEEICGYEPFPPIVIVKIEPTALKFSDSLSHRDFLGAIMSLGVRRSTIGDIVVFDKTAYAVCLENIADYICKNLMSIRHTTVRCSIIENIPDDAIPVPEESSFTVASERLDSVVAAVFKLSRSESQSFIEHEKVLIGGVACLNSDAKPSPGDIITVRSKGKFIYCGMEKETKKGRLRCNAKIYK